VKEVPSPDLVPVSLEVTRGPVEQTLVAHKEFCASCRGMAGTHMPPNKRMHATGVGGIVGAGA
jgi:hypothetical protein